MKKKTLFLILLVLTISTVYAQGLIPPITTSGSTNITNNNYYINATYNITNNITNYGDLDYTNVALTNQSNNFTGNQTTTGWWNGLFNWVIDIPSQIWMTFNGTTLTFNETKLNETIDYRVSLNNSGGSGNVTWNESYANGLYVDVTGDIMTGNLNLTNGANVTANDFIIPDMTGNNGVYTLNDFFKTITSAGRLTGGEIVNNAGTEIIVTAGTGLARIADDDISQVKYIAWVNSSPINVPTDSIMYFGIDYNSGTPIVINTTDYTEFDLDTQFPLGSVINQKDELYILNNPWWIGDGLTNVIERFQSQGWLVRDENMGGLILGVTGTRNPTLTGGVLWSRLVEHTIPAFDSSSGDTFDMYYRDGVGGYNEMADLTQYNITKWDDGSGTLQTIGNNQYAVIWVWINVASQKISLIYPQMTYPSSASAEAEQVPSTFPSMWYKGGVIAGRIIIKQGQDAPVQVQSAFTQVFTAAQAADHGNLAGLTDDDHTQYLLANGSRALSGNLNMNGYKITKVGELIMQGLINSYSVIPNLTGIYSLGNSSNKFKEIYVGDVYATNINSGFANITNINSSNINSNKLQSTQINSTEMNSTDTNTVNLTISGSKIYVKDDVTYYRGVA